MPTAGWPCQRRGCYTPATMPGLLIVHLLAMQSAADPADLVQRVTLCDAVTAVSAKSERRFRVGPGVDCKELHVFYGLEGESGGQRFIRSALAAGYALMEDKQGVEVRGPANKRPPWLVKARQQCPRVRADGLVLGVQTSVTGTGRVASVKLLGTKDVQDSLRGRCILRRAKTAPYQPVEPGTTRYIYPVDNDALGGLKLGALQESPPEPLGP